MPDSSPAVVDSPLEAPALEPLPEPVTPAASSPRVAPEDEPTPIFLTGVALISACILGFEVALTRVFGSLLRYHFAFLAISLALCGLGLGGCLASVLRRFSRLSLPLLGVLFGLSINAALAVMLRVLFAHHPDQYWLSGPLVLVPFTIGGLFLAEAFARHPQRGGRIYAWDLAGAAAAAVVVVGLLQFAGAIDAVLWIAAVAALAALLLAQGRQNIWALPCCLALLVLPVANASRKWLDVPPIPPMPDKDGLTLADRNITQPLFTELGGKNPASRILLTRQNAFARTDLVQDKDVGGNQLVLYTNGNVPTYMIRWNGQLSSIPALQLGRYYPLSDWAFAQAPLKGAQVFSIGPGAGLDALLALSYGAKHFDGAELNPSIVGLMNEYKGFNGGLYQRPDVQVRTADGRAMLQQEARAGKRYALIYSALTKTATAGQGMSLLESYIQTQDAFSDYLNALQPDGQFTIVGDNPILTARFFTTAVAEFQKRGLNQVEACRHIAIAFNPQPGPYVYSIVVSKSAFTPQQTARMVQDAQHRQIVPVWVPGRVGLYELGAPYPSVGEGRITLDDFIRRFLVPQTSDSVPLNVAPASDDRPFVLDLSPSPYSVFWSDPVKHTLSPVAWMLGCGMVVLGAFCVASIFGARRTAGSRSLLSDAGYTLYFLALGVGFMLVEIPLAQKLVLPLGYPVLALTTVLFALLLGGGAGAAWSQRYAGRALRSQAAISALAVAVLTLLLSYALLPLIEHSLAALPLVARCIVTAAFLFPLGFALGAPFPSGLRLFAHGAESRVPIVWGLNGVASVAGSIIAALGAKQYGFTVIMAGGAVIYLLAALLMLALPVVGPSPQTAVPVVSGTAYGIAEEDSGKQRSDVTLKQALGLVVVIGALAAILTPLGARIREEPDPDNRTLSAARLP